jgi:signal peptidase I
VIRLRALAAALALALAPLAFLRPVLVEGGSMQPRLRPGTVCLALRPWCAGRPAPGQVWLVRGPAGEAVKRLVGLPGDRVELRRGELWINGGRVAEPYLERPGRDTAGPWAAGPGYFLLGDNRATSLDSRACGRLSAAGLRGRILGWPVRAIPGPGLSAAKL